MHNSVKLKAYLLFYHSDKVINWLYQIQGRENSIIIAVVYNSTFQDI